MPLRFINPNLHVILIHYPLGVFVLGAFLELFALFWRRSSVRTAARWMMAFGALATLPSATSGIFALYDLKSQGINADRYDMLRLHVIFMGAASLLAVFCTIVGVGASDRWRKFLYFPLLIGVLGAWGMMVFGAWNGGEVVYRHGAGVATLKLHTVEDETDADGWPKQTLTVVTPDIEGRLVGIKDDLLTYKSGLEGKGREHSIKVASKVQLTIQGRDRKDLNADDDTMYKLSDLKPNDYVEIKVASNGTAKKIAATDKPSAPDLVQFYGGGLWQQHMILAGFAFAFALGALAMSIRRLHSWGLGREVVIAVQPVPSRRSGTDDMTMLKSFNPSTQMATADVRPTIPSGRIWLLAFLLLLGTGFVGYWIEAGQDVLKPNGFQSFLTSIEVSSTPNWHLTPDDSTVKFNRMLVHAIVGTGLILLTLICALIAAAAPRRPLLLTFFAMLLLIFMAAQVWMGVLLTFQKGHTDGPLTHFQTREEEAAQDLRINPPAAKTESKPEPSTPAPSTVPATPADTAAPVTPPAPTPDSTPAPKADSTPAPKADSTPAPKADSTPAPKADSTPAPRADSTPATKPAREPAPAHIPTTSPALPNPFE